MTAKRKTWQEKLADKPGYPKVIALQTGFPATTPFAKWGRRPAIQVRLLT